MTPLEITTLALITFIVGLLYGLLNEDSQDSKWALLTITIVIVIILITVVATLRFVK